MVMFPFHQVWPNHLASTVKRRRRHARQRKRWEDDIREWTGLQFGKSQRAVENREKMEKTGCKVICGVPTTLAVKRLMMMRRRMNMMMMMIVQRERERQADRQTDRQTDRQRQGDRQRQRQR